MQLRALFALACALVLSCDRAPIEAGELEADQYKNETLRLFVVCPDGWRLTSREELEDIRESSVAEVSKGREQLAADAELEYNQWLVAARENDGPGFFGVMFRRLGRVGYDEAEYAAGMAPLMRDQGLARKAVLDPVGLSLAGRHFEKLDVVLEGTSPSSQTFLIDIDRDELITIVIVSDSHGSIGAAIGAIRQLGEDAV